MNTSRTVSRALVPRVERSIENYCFFFLATITYYEGNNGRNNRVSYVHILRNSYTI
jgi:hypothetical protein